MVRIQPNRFIVILDRSIVISLAPVRDATVGKGIGMIRIQPDRFIVVLDRPVVISLAPISIAPII